MSRAVKVYIKGKYAGVLEEKDRNHYSFRYDDAYYNDPDTPPVSLTMPKSQQEYSSAFLFCPSLLMEINKISA
ncbi:HipA N-terminal domain-containing protein [Proteiniphilum sp.]|uniref:HipA N-terminal domain-containing protein n=1 Tax=Proteiniphilum sp. TaxID=1926877 RepID=UPI0033218028